MTKGIPKGKHPATRLMFFFLAVLVAASGGCCAKIESASKVKEREMNVSPRVTEQPSEMIYKLAYVHRAMVRAVMSGEIEPITQEMKKYVQSEPYGSINDLEGRTHLAGAFASAKGALTSEPGFNKGRFIGQVMGELMGACIYYKLPECTSVMSGGGIPVSEGSNVMNMLANRGATLWSQ